MTSELPAASTGHANLALQSLKFEIQTVDSAIELFEVQKNARETPGKLSSERNCKLCSAKAT